MRHRITVLQLFAFALLSMFASIGESYAQAKVARVGVLSFLPLTSDQSTQQVVSPFRRALADHGWVEGKNVSFEFRDAGGDPSRLQGTGAELVQLKVDVILAVGAPAVRAAQAATHTIPIVAGDYTSNPVTAGYVQSYSRPGGNLTGVFLDAPDFAGKWFQLLKAIIPGLSRVAVLWDPAPGTAHLDAVRKLAQSFRVQLQVVELRKPDEIEKAFSAFRGKPQALIILPSPITYAQGDRFAKLALRYRLPATSMARIFADAGGLVAYGPEENSTFESCGVLAAKILNGAKPADLPVQRPTKVQLVVNLKTAKALGVTVPESVLYRADEVIR